MRLYGRDALITRHGRSHVDQGGATSGQLWQFMGGGPPLFPLAVETVEAKKLEGKKKMYSYLSILLSSLPPSSTLYCPRGSFLFSFDLLIHSRYL